MRAMLLERQRPADENPLRLTDIPEPRPSAGEVRVRVSYCGVCRTDLHIVEGDLPVHKTPVVPGHQIVGVVDAAGGGVTGVREGDRVGIPWLHSTDGTCRYCRNGQENLCERARFTGYDADGGYAEATVVGADYCYPLPAGFADEHAAPLLCAGIIGYRSYRLSGAKSGDNLGLYGFGGSAHIVLQFARYLGCHVYVFTRSAHHRELAAKLGAVWVGDSKDRPPEPLDAAIVFTPAGENMVDALRVIRPGATVISAGISMSPIPQFDYNLLYGERLVRSAANSTRQDAREFLELAAQVPVQTETQLYPLADANHALQELKHSRIRAAGVLQVS
ncbi:MAG: zinc-dependent alcohol dehydrogenase family protein [Terriglobales bacterium]